MCVHVCLSVCLFIWLCVSLNGCVYKTQSENVSEFRLVCVSLCLFSKTVCEWLALVECDCEGESVTMSVSMSVSQSESPCICVCVCIHWQTY